MIWILAGVCVAALLLLGRSEFEKRYFTVKTYEVRSEKIVDGERTLVFLTDLHNRGFGKGQTRLLDAIGKVKPDAVLIGGDMMITTGSGDQVETDMALDLVKRLADNWPVYHGFGNHESRMEWRKDLHGDAYGDYCGRLTQYGVKQVKGHRRYRLGTDIELSGLELPRECYRRFSWEDMDADSIRHGIGEPVTDKFQILLAHTPVYFESYCSWGADLILSGHYHGGTIRIPFLGGVMTPQYKFFDPHCAGMFEEAGHVMIVGRGLGTHSVNIRLNNRAELVVVKLKGK